VELIDLVKYHKGIPPALLNELQRISTYKGYPSRLRYEQVKIKQEPKYEDNDENDEPKNVVEVHISNTLRQMGFQNMQEIMTSMRKIQSDHPMVGGEILIDMIMMHIVQQREEREESRKMDEARIQSEQTRIVRETEFCRAGCNGIVYSIDELLGIEKIENWAFKDSFLLKSFKVKNLFYELIHEKTNYRLPVQKLLTIEKKSRKWYGDTTEAFFGHILTEKIEEWYDELCNSTGAVDVVRNKIVQRLEAEISHIEHELYMISDDSEHMREPRLFKSAREVATSRGLMTDVIQLD
jgi:hypothetical protein